MGIWIMAGVTFSEAARKKMLWMALAAGVAFLILFGTGLHFQAKDFAAHGMSPVLRREISFAMLTMGLYAVDLLAVLMTILTSVDTLSGEIASGTIQAVASSAVFSANLTLTTRGTRQSVSIRSQGTEFSEAAITLNRS